MFNNCSKPHPWERPLQFELQMSGAFCSSLSLSWFSCSFWCDGWWYLGVDAGWLERRNCGLVFFVFFFFFVGFCCCLLSVSLLLIKITTNLLQFCSKKDYICDFFVYIWRGLCICTLVTRARAQLSIITWALVIYHADKFSNHTINA
jgi:hypothetical protein